MYSRICLGNSYIFYVVPSLFPTGEVLRLGRISGHTVNGGWSSWSSWSQCSRDCSRGIRSRKRTCSNPEPRYGGQTCLGPAQEYQECNITPCPGKKYTHIHIVHASFSHKGAHTVHTNRGHTEIRTFTRPRVTYCLFYSCTDKYTPLYIMIKLCIFLD